MVVEVQVKKLMHIDHLLKLPNQKHSNKNHAIKKESNLPQIIIQVVFPKETPILEFF